VTLVIVVCSNVGVEGVSDELLRARVLETLHVEDLVAVKHDLVGVVLVLEPSEGMVLTVELLNSLSSSG